MPKTSWLSVNSGDVRRGPAATSLQASRMAGKALKTNANNAVSTAKEITQSTARTGHGEGATGQLREAPAALTHVFAISDRNTNTKAAMTTRTESRRVLARIRKLRAERRKPASRP